MKLSTYMSPSLEELLQNVCILKCVQAGSGFLRLKVIYAQTQVEIAGPWKGALQVGSLET